jgi:flagellar basal body rod protein FlgF
MLVPITVPPDVKVEIGRDGTVSVVPESGAHSMIDRPEPVSRVAPPIATMIQTSPATPSSQ